MADCNDTTVVHEDDLEQLDKSLYDISIQDEVASMSSTPRSSRRKLCFQIGKSTLHT